MQRPNCIKQKVKQKHIYHEDSKRKWEHSRVRTVAELSHRCVFPFLLAVFAFHLASRVPVFRDSVDEKETELIFTISQTVRYLVPKG